MTLVACACRYCSWATDTADASEAGAPAVRAHVEEDVRRVCLWQALATEEGGQGGQDWWAYHAAFSQACSTAQGTLTAECSRQVGSLGRVT